ncbi:trehalose-6-phosphate synthase, partial [bacterium]|nr:trehalose-6-phosphate synthase [bacterium]
MWTRETLHKAVEEGLKDHIFIAVSNRQPYIHQYKKGKIVLMRPASGLTTAISPVMKACGGVWVVHGSGDADHEMVDEKDHFMAPPPPDESKYLLRRVWMSKEEEDGYYYGFANETLWPLSHIVYKQPTFDFSDWRYYKLINERFAKAVLSEIKGKKAFILIQDYHFALLPGLIKRKRPDVLIAHFWHIPWPNSEVFGICPYKHEVLEGLLANDLLGFHVRYHCDNFFSSVEQELECRVDRERSSVWYQGKETLVKPFPISVDYESIDKTIKATRPESSRKLVRNHISVLPEILCFGADRIDYTKGIPERLRAIDRFLEKHPEYKERFTYLGIGSPSRVHIEAYRDLADQISDLVEEINWKHKSGSWVPIVYVDEHTDKRTLLSYYRIADLCLVSSLHDGMNLVAKEFVAASRSKEAMLILSQWTGAARELTDSILVNPYDTEGFADAIYEAISMPAKEKRDRMRRMKQIVRENNIY